MSTGVRVMPYGDRAVLVEVGNAGAVLPVRAALDGVAGVYETVPAARTVLVRLDPAVIDSAEIARIASSAGPSAAPATTDTVRLAVSYDGPDVAPLADELGISADDLVRRHADGEYTVAFCGFSPGFAYLTGLEPFLQVPRLAEPRRSVPAGSVAIAGEYTGVYPRSSPGGWRLLGRTPAVLWDSSRSQPALLRPGCRVVFDPT